MKISRVLMVAYLSSVMLLTACTKETEEVQQVVQAYDYGIPLTETQQSPKNVAVQYANYIRAGYMEHAYDLVYKDSETYYSIADMVSMETQLQDLGDDYILYNVKEGSNSVVLQYGLKIGEAYSKDTKQQAGEYLGEVITNEIAIPIPIKQENGLSYIRVNEDYLTTTQYALNVPNDVEVWFGDMLLDATKRDDANCYILTEFVAKDYITLTLKSNIEERNIIMVLNPESEEVKGISAAENILVYPNTELYNGIQRYDYEWPVKRETLNTAIPYIQDIMQKLFDGAIEQVDLYELETLKTEYADEMVIERIKPDYLRLMNAYVDSKTKNLDDLYCVDVALVDEDYMQRKMLSNKVNNTDEIQVYVTVTYSYVAESSVTGLSTPYTGESSGYIYLTKDKTGMWKLVNIDSKLLKMIR